MPTMNVSLPAGLARFVESAIESGEYGTASEVVREGLRLLQQRREKHTAMLEALRREVAIGIADADAGRFSEETAADVAARLVAARARV